MSDSTCQQPNSVQQFAGKLFKILRVLYSLTKGPTNSKIIEWQPHRHGFVIHNIKLLESEILPQYFRHSRYASFVRQLNMYDFHKVRMHSDDNVFCHSQFIELKAQYQVILSELLHKIQRKNCKKDDSNDKQNLPLATSKNTEQLIEKLVENVRATSSDEKEQRRLVYRLREKPEYHQLSGTKYLEQIYQQLDIAKPKNDQLEQLSIEEEIEYGEDKVQFAKSPALLRSEFLLLRKNSDLFSLAGELRLTD